MTTSDEEEPAASDKLPVKGSDWAENLREKRLEHQQRSKGYRIGYMIVAFVVLALGILAIPFPGPGWAIVFLGLGMLALEFDWAEQLAMIVLAGLERFWEWWSDAPRWMQAITGLLLLGVIALAMMFAATLLGSPDFVPKLW